MSRPTLLRLRFPKRLSAFAVLFAAGIAASFALVVNASTATVNTTLSVSVTAENSCAPTALTAPAGTVTIVYTNSQDYQQNFGIQGVGWASPQDVRRGQSATISAQLAPGTYTFWCGDRPEPDKSTTGTLTVTSSGTTTSATTTAPGTTTPPATTTAPPPAPSTLSVTAGDDFFQPTTLRATAGTITVNVTNTGASSHTWTIANVVSATLAPGQTKTVTFSAAAGSYRFYCAYHASMVGTLTVDPAPAPPPGTTTTAPPPPTTPPATTAPATTTAPQPPPGSGSSSASVTATDFMFTPNTIDVPAGTVALTFTNHGSLPHTFTVDGLVNVRLDPGQTQTTTFAAAAGTYRIYCAEPGHADMGMVGTLRVGGSGGAPATTTTAPGTTTPPGGTTTAPPAGGGGGGADVDVTEFSFAPSTITRPAGSVTLSVANRGRLPHTLTIDGLVNVSLQPGETKTVSFNAAPGSYRIYCAVSGHAALGMTATLVVTGPGGSTGTTAAGTTTTSTAGAGGGDAAAAAAPATVPVTCVPRRVGAFTLTGTVAGTAPSRLLVAVTGATKVRARYAGKTVAVPVSGRTRFLGAVTDGLKPGLRAKVTVGRCRAHQALRPATQVVLSAAPAAAPLAPGTLELHADARGLPAFDKTSLTAPAGKVTLRLVNPSPLEHNVTLQGYGAGKTVGKGGVSTVTADLKPGTYTFFCSIPGHAQAGMKGTLVVH